SGISITVKESGRLERENISFIDRDEIDSLLAGLDYISKVTKSATSLELFEADYRTKGDFTITVFNSKSGGLSAAVTSGRIGKTRAFLDIEDIQELRSLILKAKE